jgi:hypothetical protein
MFVLNVIVSEWLTHCMSVRILVRTATPPREYAHTTRSRFATGASVRRARWARARSGAAGARPLMRVFLSFASEDSSVARRLAGFFEELGVEVFCFDDIRRQVGRVVGEMEEQLAAADLFIALPSNVSSRSAESCMREQACWATTSGSTRPAS